MLLNTGVVMVIKGKKAITLFVEAELYNKYKKFCDERGLKFSKGFEFYMQSQLSGTDAAKKDELEELIKEKVKEILGLKGGRHG
jgi:hypothetical protein